MAQNDALPPHGTVDASGWLHNMRGDAMSMPGFGHLSDSVIVHTGASAYSAHQNGGNSAPQASTPHAAMAATCPDPTYREIVRCPAPSHFLRPRADVHAHAEANNMESEIDKHAHDDMKKTNGPMSKVFINPEKDEDSFFVPNIVHSVDGLIHDSVFDWIPECLKPIVAIGSNRQERDVLLLGAITVISGCLPNIYGLYDNRIVYPNLFAFNFSHSAVYSFNKSKLG